ncbi:MAG: flagellar type III secretion system pore protein FliP [Succinivibrionaceae bacterium]|nr:flagellar type III secretion system pore protein FliP [Succinivibrionaceae bacterium]
MGRRDPAALRALLPRLLRTFKLSAALAALLGALLCLTPLALGADLDLEAFTVKTNPDGTQDYGIKVQALLLMTFLSFLPSVVVMMTSFARITIVLAILRQAMGLQTSPSNQIIIGMALFLTMFIMSPVFDEIYTEAIEPYTNDQIEAREALDRGQRPLHRFMLSQTRATDLGLFLDFANLSVDKPEDAPMRVLIPAYMMSELKTAFQMGFMLFLPFLIIDLVVASILMAMGMMMLSPMIVSLPFKLMLFVMVDGWALVMGTLVSSYGIGVAT